MAAQKYLCCAPGSHGMAARRPGADLIKFLDRFHKTGIISFLSPPVAHTLANCLSYFSAGRDYLYGTG